MNTTELLITFFVSCIGFTVVGFISNIIPLRTSAVAMCRNIVFLPFIPMLTPPAGVPALSIDEERSLIRDFLIFIRFFFRVKPLRCVFFILTLRCVKAVMPVPVDDVSFIRESVCRLGYKCHLTVHGHSTTITMV
jgi:hypothetical protein